MHVSIFAAIHASIHPTRMADALVWLVMCPGASKKGENISCLLHSIRDVTFFGINFMHSAAYTPDAQSM
jgi:hypothetical protein